MLLKKFTNNKFWRESGVKGTLFTVGGNASAAVLMENSIKVPQKIKT